MLLALHRLPTGSLRSLAASLRAGVLSAGVTRFGIQQAAGADAHDVETALRFLDAQKLIPSQMAIVIDAIADARDAQLDPAKLFDLVLSGPDLPGVPTSDTAAVVRTLVTQADSEVLLVGYAIHDGRELFKPLAERMKAISNLRVTFYLDIRRAYGDRSEETDLVRRFGIEFLAKHWPWSNLPEVYYDPRSLAAIGQHRASLHAKCVIIDRKEALVTSANFTEAAQQRNIEAGVLIRHTGMVQRLASYFKGLQLNGSFKACALQVSR